MQRKRKVKMYNVNEGLFLVAISERQERKFKLSVTIEKKFNFPIYKSLHH